jgi:hypothetical protein
MSHGVFVFHSTEYLCLTDLTHAYRNPSLIDIKMGTQTYDDDAPVAKREMEIAKFPSQTTLGFRFTGMKVITLVDSRILC